MDTWLDQYVKGHNKPKTYSDYECLIRIHIKLSAVGKTALKDIKPRNLQSFYNHKSSSIALNGKGGLLSPLTVRKIHAIIHKALDQAIFNGLVPCNPANGVKLPHHEKKDMRVLTSEEQQKLLDAIETDRLEAAFILELGSGLRIGELLALQWKDIDIDIDLEGKTLQVRQSLGRIRTPGEVQKTRLIIQEPKTKSGKRSIPLVSGGTTAYCFYIPMSKVISCFHKQSEIISVIFYFCLNLDNFLFYNMYL
ncbi:site-specific integrase [Desulfosporosinus sp. SRJS8]|nr:site-specific integrase [Desulfosporosinus sp. SRJS8]